MPPDEQDPLEQLKALKQRQAPARPTVMSADPLEQLKALKRSAPLDPQTHQDIGDLRNQIESTSVARKGTQDSTDAYAAPGILGGVQKGAEALVSGLPGAQRAVAGYRGILALLGGQGIEGAANEVDRSLTGQRADVASLPKKARIPLQIAGSLPAAAATAPLGVFGGGAAFGAAAGADKDANNFGDRAKNTVEGGILGGLLSKGTQLGGRGLKNLSDRSGLSDLVAQGAQKLSPSLASTLGTRGQVNETLGRLQDIKAAAAGVDRPQSFEVPTLGDQRVSMQSAHSAENDALYNTARAAEAKSGPVTDPELLGHLNDPRVRKVFQTIASLRKTGQNPLAGQAMGTTLSPSVGEATQLSDPELQSAGAAFEQMLRGEGPSSGLPDAQAFATAKREIGRLAYGASQSQLPLKQEEAQALYPIFERISTRLHALYPERAAADQAFAASKGVEGALETGADAFRKGLNPSGGQLLENSPEAMQQAISSPRYAAEPPWAMDARQSAFRSGVRGAMGQDIDQAEVTKDLAKVLASPSLSPSQQAQRIRALGATTPDEAGRLEQLLATARGKSLARPGGDVSQRVPHSLYDLISKGIQKASTSPDLLNTPKGQSMIAERLGSPSMLLQELTDAAKSQQPYQPFPTEVPGLDRLPSFGTSDLPGNEFLRRLLLNSSSGQATR